VNGKLNQSDKNIIVQVIKMRLKKKTILIKTINNNFITYLLTKDNFTLQPLFPSSLGGRFDAVLIALLMRFSAVLFSMV